MSNHNTLHNAPCPVVSPLFVTKFWIRIICMYSTGAMPSLKLTFRKASFHITMYLSETTVYSDKIRRFEGKFKSSVN